MAEFRNRDDAYEHTVFVCLAQPGNHSSIRTRFCPFRDHVRIEQEAHSSILRMPPFARRTLRPEPRKGDAEKKSARLPTLCVFRSHSSADTITTAVRPFFVIV